ncbi:MAG: hypothetical protein HDT00_06495, partial [Bacteroidales bacterium]|nr:hypothetical protein [Bacteroidales bacterium]
VMTRLAAIIVALAAMVMVGCAGREKNREVDRDLNAAESLMESQPDSALRMLQRIDTLATLSGERRARHALLLSQAYHKNYIDLTDDSLISIAVDYYAQTDNAHYRLLSYHYLGAIYLNAGQYGPALHAALNAHDQAVESGDTVNLVRIESLLGRIYAFSNDFKEGLRWDSLALEKAKSINHRKWMQNCYQNVAADYVSMAQCNEGLQYIDSAIAITGENYPHALSIQFSAYFGLEMDDKADSILMIMNEMGIEPDEEVKPSIEYWEKRSPEETIAYQNQAISDLNAYIINMYKGNLSSSLNQYLEEKSRRMNETIERKKTQIVNLTVFGILGLAVLTLLFVVYRLRVKAQRNESDKAFQILSIDLQRAQQEVENRRLAILNMQKDMEHLSQQANDAQLRAEVAQQSSAELRNKVSVAYLKRFEWVNKLEKLYSTTQGAEAEKKLYKAITTEINNFNPNAFINEIETVCRNQYPELWEEILGLGLKQNDRKMLLLLVSGMSPSTIALLYSKSSNAVYITKTRLKEKLGNINTPLSLHLMSII